MTSNQPACNRAAVLKTVDGDCKRCGRCCSYEIPLTLLDISRLAKATNLTTETVFKKFIDIGQVTAGQGLFKLSKNESGACVFLHETNICSLHEHRPWTCAAYFCQLDRNHNSVSWVSFCSSPQERRSLWAQAVAVETTKAYIEEYGAQWKPEPFHRALARITDFLEESPDKKVRLARKPDGAPIAMAFDCSTCENRGREAHETIVSLDDIERLCKLLKTTPRRFFQRYINSEISTTSGCLQLRRNGCCIFHQENGQCSVKEAQPMHCQFVPCPKAVSSAEEADCYYLAGGSLQQQYRHQVALSITRGYAEKFGASFNEKHYRSALAKLNSLLSAKVGFEDFCEEVRPYRYIDDTLPAATNGRQVGRFQIQDFKKRRN